MPVVVADTGSIYTFVAESATDETIVKSESWHCITGDSIADEWEELV